MNKNKGGLILTDSIKEETNLWKSCRSWNWFIFSKWKSNPNTVQVGDRVLYTKNESTNTTVDDEELLLFSEHELLGLLDELFTNIR